MTTPRAATVPRVAAAVILTAAALATTGCERISAQSTQPAVSPEGHAASIASKKAVSTMNNSDNDLANNAWAKQACTRPEALAGLAGRSEAELEKLLGAADQKDAFLMGERTDEFHITLQNTYPLTKASNKQVAVHELTWKRGSCKLTVWLHQIEKEWRVFENSRYSATAEF